MNKQENNLRKRLLKELSIAGGRLCDRDILGQTPLHFAIAQNDIDAIEVLLHDKQHKQAVLERERDLKEHAILGIETGEVPSLEPPPSPRGVPGVGMYGEAACDVLAADVTGTTALGSMLGIASSVVSTMRMMQSMPAPPEELEKSIAAAQGSGDASAGEQ